MNNIGFRCKSISGLMTSPKLIEVRRCNRWDEITGVGWWGAMLKEVKQPQVMTADLWKYTEPVKSLCSCVCYEKNNGGGVTQRRKGQNHWPPPVCRRTQMFHNVSGTIFCGQTLFGRNVWRIKRLHTNETMTQNQIRRKRKCVDTILYNTQTSSCNCCQKPALLTKLTKYCIKSSTEWILRCLQEYISFIDSQRNCCKKNSK